MTKPTDTQKVCAEANLWSWQAIRGAEAMRLFIAEDLQRLLLTASVRPVHERLSDYINTLKQTSHDGE